MSATASMPRAARAGTTDVAVVLSLTVLALILAAATLRRRTA